MIANRQRRPRGPCANPECPFDVIGRDAYRALAPEERDGVRAHGAYGACRPCYLRMQARGTYEILPRPGRPVADVAEDWTLLVDRTRSQMDNVRAIAPRLGMSEQALERAVLRAKRRGLVAA